MKQTNHPLFHLRNAHLVPFLAVALFGVIVLVGWWSGQVAWVQPSVLAAPLVANAALAFVLIGLAPLLIAAQWPKTGAVLALLAALLGWLPVIDLLTGLSLQPENLLTQHDQLIAGQGVGRMPAGLALILALAGSLLARSTWQPPLRRLNLLLALTGSLACAHGLTALLAANVGLNQLDFWQTHAQLGPHTAIALLLLGGALFFSAAPKPDRFGRTHRPRWLWLPAVVAGVTMSFLFWVSLKARENTHVNQTTQLTINHIASLYSNEIESQINGLRALATRWAGVEEGSSGLHEKDARILLETFPACTLVHRVDDHNRTADFWPAAGHEEAAALDHAGEPLRRQALTTARDSLTFGLAGPLQSPLRPPFLALYTPILRAGRFDGFAVGEFDYARLFGLIDRRLNISERFQLEISVRGPDGVLTVYRSAATSEPSVAGLHQSAIFNLQDQRITIHLTPLPHSVRTDQNSLANLALLSGLGVSLLVGLVINLAQTARTRQRMAESTAQDLFAENEERRRVETALRASQTNTRLLTHVAERTENLVFITTATGLIQWTNDSFTRFTGHSLADVAGSPLLELVSNPPNSPGSLDQLAAALNEYRPLTTEVIILNQEHDRSCHLRFELQPAKNEEGLTENFIAVGTDITTSVQTEANLRRAKTEADTASRAKSEFLATVSHEIRTPMNGVIGMTSLLLDTPLNPEQREFVGTIRTSGQSLLEVINEILDFSKLESGHLEIEHQPLEIAQCVEEAVYLHVLTAAAKHIEIACHVDAGVPPWILLDMTRLRQVLANLLSNAVKFTARGHITVEVRAVPAPASTRLCTLDFYVRDTGIGIAPEHRGRLFKPFSQIDSSNTRKYGGTGLGLAICDRLCQLLGGFIEFQENPGGGSVFHFQIQAEPTPPPVPATLPVLPASLRHANVLVVDDLPLNRLTLRQVLHSLNLLVLEAADAADARLIAANSQLAAAIIDHDLAGASGESLAAELRTRFPELLIIHFTPPAASATPAGLHDRHQLRLPKPIRPALLLEKLAEYFRSHQAAPANPPGNNIFSTPSVSTTTVAPVATTPATPFTASLATQIPLRILIVEDNPVNQKVAQRFLSRLGYESTLASNGLAALQTLDEASFDLVLMDMMMPEMDGLTATREIRLRYPATRQPRVFALTANAITGDRERCLEAGMDDYLSKPVKIENIELLIRKYFEAK